MDADTLKIEQIKKLIEYTQFHIGLYLTLIAGLSTLLGLDVLKLKDLTTNPTERQRFFYCFCSIIVCFFLAGVCGAVVCSKLIDPYQTYPFWKNQGLKALANPFNQPVGFGPFQMAVKYWAGVGHAFFWLGVLIALVTFFLIGRRKVT